VKKKLKYKVDLIVKLEGKMREVVGSTPPLTNTTN